MPKTRLMPDTVTDSGDHPADATLARLGWFFGVPFRRATYYRLAYLLLAFPLGIAYLMVVTIGVALGLSLAILLIGIPILALTVAFSLVVAGFERVLTNRLVGTDIESRTELAGESSLAKVKGVVLDWRTYAAFLYLPAKFVLGTVAFVFIFTILSTVVAMMMVPLYYDQPGLYVGVVTERAPEIHQTIYLGWNYLLVGFEAAFTFGYWEIDSLGAALIVGGVGVLGLLVTLHVCNAVAGLWGRLAVRALNGGYDPLAAMIRGSEVRR